MSNSTIGLNFSTLTQPQANALRAILNELAGDLGYVALSGPTTDASRGVLAHMLVAIGAGEVAVVKLADEQRTEAIIDLDWLDEKWADVIAAALRAALIRQFKAAEREANDGIL